MKLTWLQGVRCENHCQLEMSQCRCNRQCHLTKSGQLWGSLGERTHGLRCLEGQQYHCDPTWSCGRDGTRAVCSWFNSRLAETWYPWGLKKKYACTYTNKHSGSLLVPDVDSGVMCSITFQNSSGSFDNTLVCWKHRNNCATCKTCHKNEKKGEEKEENKGQRHLNPEMFWFSACILYFHGKSS